MLQVNSVNLNPNLKRSLSYNIKQHLVLPMDSNYFDDLDSSVEIRYTRKRIHHFSSNDDNEDDQCSSLVN
ncbi:hypothetical protein M0804_013706 [Polistes exclamans]|nr:hypothetical protein M0804_013706 [Polistes exclamans]